MYIISKANTHGILLRFFVIHDILDTREVEAQGEAHRLIQRVRSSQTYAVGDIQRNDGEVETGTEGKIVTVTFVVVLVAITGTSEELLVVGVLDTGTPTNLSKLLFASARSVCEGLEPTFRRVQRRILFLSVFTGRLIRR